MKSVLKWFARYIGSLGTVGMGMVRLKEKGPFGPLSNLLLT